MYPDTKFMTGAEQERAFKTFKRVIDKRDSQLIDKNLYNHLHVHCGFIAHYNIHGFRTTYSGTRGFREFIKHFDLNNPEMAYWHHWLRGDYEQLNRDMAEYVTARAALIYAELDRQEREKEIALAQALLARNGVKVNLVDPEPEVPIVSDGTGQLVIGF